MVLTIVAALIIISALFGLHMLLRIFKNQKTPNGSIIIHGLLNVTALVLLIIAVAGGAGGLIVTALVVIVIAALGGLILFYIDYIQKTQPPKALAIIHPIIGVIGLILLIVYITGR